MNVISIQFLCFILVLIFIYYSVPAKKQWIVLLIGSLAFYLSGGWKCIFLIAFTIVNTFLAARKLGTINGQIKHDIKEITDRDQRKREKEKLIRKKKGIVAVTLVVNFAILFFFKTSFMWKEVPFLLPLGISFYTFQMTGYLIDVYRSEYEPEGNLFRYALFASYFPQIIQGPINRYKILAPQFFKEHKPDWRNIKFGCWLFLWGMFKKLVIAGNAENFVSIVINGELSETPGSIILLSAFLFNIQLYTDFSGGIDMMRGVSQMFGIEMAENFRRPFFSESLGEYWRRWHISLGAWIKDYVFYPIAMSKLFSKIGKRSKKLFGDHIGKNLPGGIASVITFVLIGLWHNVTIYYVAYGLWHGIIMAMSTMCVPLFKKYNDYFNIKTDCFSYRLFRRFRTWMIITIGEYFTLPESTSASLMMLKRTVFHFQAPELYLSLCSYGLNMQGWIVLGITILILAYVSVKQEEGICIREAMERQNLSFQCLMTIGIIFVIAIFGIYGPGYNAADFIYGGF